MILYALLYAFTNAWPHALGGGDCVTDEDCQLAGVCTSGRCRCDAAWRGTHCTYLAINGDAAGAGYRRADTSSWGGRSWRGADGKHHGFFSEFGGSCGMNEWDNTSHVVHAVAPIAAPRDG